jgi:membrane protein DedA with SNARE-associated domain
MKNVDSVLSILYYFFATFGYLGVSGIFLFITIFPFPIPEELILLAIGYSIGHEIIKPTYSFLFSWWGIIGGDVYLYLFGRFLGRRIFIVRPFRFIFKERRIRKAEGIVKRYGGLSVIIGRFIWGIRSQIFMINGLFKFHPIKFLIVDLATSIVEVGVFIFIGYYFKNELQIAFNTILKYKNHSIVIILIIITGIALFFIMRRILYRGNFKGYPKDF